MAGIFSKTVFALLLFSFKNAKLKKFLDTQLTQNYEKHYTPPSTFI